MANTVRTNPVSNMDGYVEFDYKNPTAKQRVRRKIQANSNQSDLLKSLLEHIMDNNYDFDSTVSYIRTNNFYSQEAAYYEEAVQSLYFNYSDKASTTTEIEREEQKNILLDDMFPLSEYKANFCFLGKAGVGKSTLIKKMSQFWGNKEVSFPFTDTSRTSTFPADYCFVPKTNDFKFIATLMPPSIIDLNISECIDRAVNKLLDLKINNLYNEQTSIDDVIVAFISDPTQSFDIRYSVGRYIKTTSPSYDNPNNAVLLTFWNQLYTAFNSITIEVINNDLTDHEEISYYQLKYTDAVKAGGEDNYIYKTYQYVLDLINQQMVATQTDLVLELKNNDSIEHISVNMANENVPYISCNIRYQNGEAFYKFIRAFTTKKASEFGRSFFNIVTHLRIELPLNKNIKLPQTGYSFIVQDTIGIAHSNDGNGGFENSTHLKMEDVDAVLIIDDARMNGDNNVSAILSHLLARIAPYKIHFAFTFFNDLEKADFDEEDDLDEQRTSYLITTETNTIRSTVKDPDQAKILLNKLNASDSFFMNGLMDDNFDSVNHLLKVLIQQKIRLFNSFNLYKPDLDKPFVIYDYKKLPLLYQQALTAFTKQQNSIYQVSPPHYKTTEALTNRLRQGITFFSGARTLRPVDDLYDVIIQSLSEFIDKPAAINFNAVENESTEIILGMLKTQITESIRISLNTKFFSKNAIDEWQKLYFLSGIGCDKTRRNGIIRNESNIAPGLDEYLNSSVNEHIINIIEESFVSAINNLEQKLELDK